MIVLDSSAIVAILILEAEAQTFGRIVARNATCVGVPTLVETRIVLENHFGMRAAEAVRRFLSDSMTSVVPFDASMSEISVSAFSRYGKGRSHPARLNFGDCLTYAVGKALSLPLLFKGNDFIHTDLVLAYDLPA